MSFVPVRKIGLSVLLHVETVIQQPTRWRDGNWWGDGGGIRSQRLHPKYIWYFLKVWSAYYFLSSIFDQSCIQVFVLVLNIWPILNILYSFWTGKITDNLQFRSVGALPESFDKNLNGTN